jgi:hypothetical protein
LNELQKEYVAILTEMNKLIIATAVAVLGAVGVFVQRLPPIASIPLPAQVFLSASFLLAGLALFFSYECYRYLAEMLGNSFLMPSSLIDWFQHLQILTLFSSVIALGLAAITANADLQK